ncbi:MAG: aminotransferase class V-fold PLP-dependent enzyme, partial [Pseudomonadota bacterium]
YTCKQVIDRLNRFYTTRKVQPYGAFGASAAGGDEMDEAQTRIAAMLNVGADELSFGPSTTQNTYVLARAFAQMLEPGDAIVVTNQDHEANTGPWRRLAADGIEVREWQVNPETGALEIEGLRAVLDPNVRLVCFPHCSNIVGHENPVAEWCAEIQAAGASACVDGVSWAPHGFPDVEALGADIYLFSSYKTYGPHQGLMVIRQPLMALLPNQGHYFNDRYSGKRMSPAGPDHAQVAACAGMADYVDALYARHFNTETPPAGRSKAVNTLMRNHEIALIEPVLETVASLPRLRLIGPERATDRAPTIAVHGPKSGEAMARALADRGVMAGGGDFYAVRLLEALGIDPDHGVLRLSFTHYTAPWEVERLCAALPEVV